MPLLDYSKPSTFLESAEAVSVVLQYMLVQLRDHVAFEEEHDQSIMRAAEIVSSVLEDAHTEVEHLIGKIVVG